MWNISIRRRVFLHLIHVLIMLLWLTYQGNQHLRGTVCGFHLCSRVAGIVSQNDQICSLVHSQVLENHCCISESACFIKYTVCDASSIQTQRLHFHAPLQCMKSRNSRYIVHHFVQSPKFSLTCWHFLKL